MTWGQLSGYSTFEKARRKEVGRRLSRLVRGKEADSLLALGDVREHLGLYEQWYVGIRSIPVANIVGSVDRAADFDRTFLPKKASMETRWKRVEQAFAVEAFPPIVTFKVGDAYFIEDGHHRVAIARQRKDEFIDAEVTEVKSPVPVDATTDVAAIVHMGMRRWFMKETSLDRVRPQADIDPSRPHAYAELLDIVQSVGFEMMMHRGEIVSPAAASAHWWDDFYLPTVRRIKASKLPTIFPQATGTDLYLRVHAQHRELEAVATTQGVEDAVPSTAAAASTGVKAKARLAVEEAKGAINEAKAKAGSDRTDKGNDEDPDETIKPI